MLLTSKPHEPCSNVSRRPDHTCRKERRQQTFFLMQKSISGLFSNVRLFLKKTFTRRATGWRRRIGCLKLQDIFHQRATIYRFLLHKVTFEDKASYDSTPPCRLTCTYIYIHIHLYKSALHAELAVHAELGSMCGRLLFGTQSLSKRPTNMGFFGNRAGI